MTRNNSTGAATCRPTKEENMKGSIYVLVDEYAGVVWSYAETREGIIKEAMKHLRRNVALTEAEYKDAEEAYWSGENDIGYDQHIELVDKADD